MRDVLAEAIEPGDLPRLYASFEDQNPLWNEIPTTGARLRLGPTSTYIQEPPFFGTFSVDPGQGRGHPARGPLAIFGDSVTTDHISPRRDQGPSPAGTYLIEQRRRGRGLQQLRLAPRQRPVMTRGTFANVRIKT
jgi:aconitate hydratase